jgi:hypothetical protein
MDTPEKLAAQDTQDEEKQNKNTTQHKQKSFDKSIMN